MLNYSTLLIAVATMPNLAFSANVNPRQVNGPFQMPIWTHCGDDCDNMNADTMLVTQLAPNSSLFSGTNIANFPGEVDPNDAEGRLAAMIDFESRADKPKQVWFDHESAGVHLACNISIDPSAQAEATAPSLSVDRVIDVVDQYGWLPGGGGQGSIGDLAIRCIGETGKP